MLLAIETCNRLGGTLGDGAFGEVEVSPQSVGTAQHFVQRALDAFEWRGPRMRLPSSSGKPIAAPQLSRFLADTRLTASGWVHGPQIGAEREQRARIETRLQIKDSARSELDDCVLPGS
jgi:hypothetical protein